MSQTRDRFVHQGSVSVSVSIARNGLLHPFRKASQGLRESLVLTLEEISSRGGDIVFLEAQRARQRPAEARDTPPPD